MKIRILTRRAGYNFGSSLQAYAMQQIVSKLGYDNLVVNYDELHHNVRWQIRPFIDDCLFKILGIAPFLNRAKYEKLKYRSIQRAKFDEFDNLIRKTDKLCRTSADLKGEMNDSYACICGSDQIWNPFLFDRNFFLPYITNKSVKKIAYAPSLGISDKGQCPKEMVDMISRFDSIAIREQVGADIISELLNRPISTVLDPTLLLDVEDWRKVEKRYDIDGEYILCYFLGQKYIPHDFIDRLKRNTGLKVVNIQMYYNVNNLDADINLWESAPDEFIYILSKAKYICSDSFHCAVFSSIYRKDFFVFNRFGNNDLKSQNSRIDSLLALLGLENRRVNNNTIIDNNILQEVDYSNSKVETASRDSLKYLYEALSRNK